MELSAKAAVYSKAEAGKVLEIRDLDQPLPRSCGFAASVNPLDWRLKTEQPGLDVASEIIAVGKNVTQFKPGDRVIKDIGVAIGRAGLASLRKAIQCI